MQSRLTGLIAAPFTAVHSDGSINLEAIAAQAARLRSDGVSGVFICGTTGESVSFSGEERRRIAETWAEERGDLRLVVHVADACLAEAQKMAAHAQSIGADAIAAMPISPFRPEKVDALIDWCAAIAQAAPELPFYYYHIPSLSKVEFKARDILTRGAERISTLAGCKFTYEDLWDFERCRSLYDGSFDMLFGRDEILLAGAALGARGFVGSTYNFAAPLYLRILDALEMNDLEEARLWQDRASEMVAVLAGNGGLPAMKALMGVLGLELGPMRLPWRPLETAQIVVMTRQLEQLGFFDWLDTVLFHTVPALNGTVSTL